MLTSAVAAPKSVCLLVRVKKGTPGQPVGLPFQNAVAEERDEHQVGELQDGEDGEGDFVERKEFEGKPETGHPRGEQQFPAREVQGGGVDAGPVLVLLEVEPDTLDYKTALLLKKEVWVWEVARDCRTRSGFWNPFLLFGREPARHVDQVDADAGKVHAEEHEEGVLDMEVEVHVLQEDDEGRAVDHHEHRQPVLRPHPARPLVVDVPEHYRGFLGRCGDYHN